MRASSVGRCLAWSGSNSSQTVSGGVVTRSNGSLQQTTTVSFGHNHAVPVSIPTAQQLSRPRLLHGELAILLLHTGHTSCWRPRRSERGPSLDQRRVGMTGSLARPRGGAVPGDGGFRHNRIAAARVFLSSVM